MSDEFIKDTAPRHEYITGQPVDEAHNTGLPFYRCMLCSGVVSVWDIKAGGCPKCAGTRIRPTNLSLWEKIISIIKHPKVWTWKDQTPPPNMIDPKSL